MIAKLSSRSWLLVFGIAIGFGAARMGSQSPERAPIANPVRAEEPQRPVMPTAVEQKPDPTKKRSKPNILFLMADNLGYGELGCYGGGILRGAATPRIDKLASQGTRLLNYNVEPQCTPSRSALMTGRFPIRSGTMTVPRGGRPYGLTPWEITIAEMLSALGYSTGHFGKWHLGSIEGRMPTNQGFDEWYGIPNSTSVSPWTSSPDFDPKAAPTPYILEGKKGEPTKKVEVYDLKSRRLIDAEITKRTIAYMQEQSKAGKPFFAYVPFTQVHYPTLPHPDFAGKTGYGDHADSLAELDHRVGQILDALRDLGEEENTLVVFTSDNGPEEMLPWRGWAGPWSGSYFTAMEGSLRAPFIVRQPGVIPEGRISNEIVHIVDLFPTLARIVGGEVPKDRILDGVDQWDFLRGLREKSFREGFPVYVGDTLFAIKWRHWKLHLYWQEYMFDAPQKLPNPRLFNLITDPRERNSITSMNTWVFHPMFQIVDQLTESLKKEPAIPPGGEKQ